MIAFGCHSLRLYSHVDMTIQGKSRQTRIVAIIICCKQHASLYVFQETVFFFVRALALDVDWFHCTVLVCILPFALVVIQASECPGSIILYRKYP